MPSVVDNNTSSIIHLTSYFYRLKPFLLPLLVPVFVFGLLHIIADADALKGEILQRLLQRRFVEKGLLHVACQTVLRFHKRLKSRFSRQCRQHVAGIARVGAQGECYLEIFHIVC